VPQWGVPMAVLEGKSLEHTFLVSLKTATATLTFLVSLIVTSVWELLVHLPLNIAVIHRAQSYDVTDIILRV